MKAYFLSDENAYLKVNGNFVGEVGKNVKVADISEDCLLEFLPKNPLYAPAYSNENGSFLIKVHQLFLGRIYYVNYEKKRCFPYKILSQNGFIISGVNTTLTVLLDGAIKFFIDGKICVTDELPFLPTSAKLQEFCGSIFAIFYGKKTAVYAYDNGGNLKYKNIVNSFDFDVNFNTKTQVLGVCKLEILECYDVKNNFKLVKRSVLKNKSAFEINKNLLPVLFFELILNGANASEILSQNLAEKQGDLSAFLGDVKHYFLNPYSQNEVVAIYEERASIYETIMQGGIITNIIEKD